MTDEVKARVVASMEAYFGADLRRIEHAHRVTRYAETILRGEPGDSTVVVATAVLHDIGIHAAEEKHGSTAGRYQEIEGPPIAREMLTRLGFSREQTDEVCDIIAHHHSPGIIDTVNFRIVYDADWLVNLAETYDVTQKGRLPSVVDKLFRTPTGKELARKVYLSAGS